VGLLDNVKSSSAPEICDLAVAFPSSTLTLEFFSVSSSCELIDESKLDDESLTSIHGLSVEDPELVLSAALSFSSRRRNAPSEYSVESSSGALSDDSSSSNECALLCCSAPVCKAAPLELQKEDATPERIVGNPTERLRLLPASDCDVGSTLLVYRLDILS
jgi:hypothetical protein